MDLKEILILSGIIILVIIIAYLFRKSIYLNIIRMIYGQYSSAFFLTYKKFYIRSPFQYCFRDDFSAHLLFVLYKKQGIPSYKSLKEICFEGTPYFINYKDFIKRKRNPYCFNAFVFDHSEFEIKAVGYQEIIAGSKAIAVFYFMNDSFFLGEYIFKSPKTNVKANLVNHFLGSKDIPEDDFYIDNTRNRIIHYQNTGFTIDIKYLNKEDEFIISNLNEYYNYITGKKIVPEA